MKKPEFFVSFCVSMVHELNDCRSKPRQTQYWIWEVCVTFQQLNNGSSHRESLSEACWSTWTLTRTETAKRTRKWKIRGQAEDEESEKQHRTKTEARTEDSQNPNLNKEDRDFKKQKMIQI